MPFTHLDYDQVLGVHERSLEAGLERQRRLLFGGIPRLYISSLPTDNVPAHQVLSDLNEMNRVPSIIGNIVPLERWLRNAAYQMAARPDLQAFFRDLAEEVAAASDLEPTGEPAGVSTGVATFQEKIVHVDDKLAVDFLDKAAAAATAVARLTVPRIEGGTPVTFPLSTQPMEYYGTGWLLGRGLVITNHHVINARDPGEPDASDADFKLQGKATKVEFDYHTLGQPGNFGSVGEVIAEDKKLDFTLLQLTDDTGRTPLRLWSDPLSVPEGSYAPVNIVQHPGGSPKQIALRNNLVARLTELDLAYFTDTEEGSSGSPVCNDDWFVVALHKASTRALGSFKFQGKSTAWVNTGTRIDCLIEHFKTALPSVWSEIQATG